MAEVPVEHTPVDSDSIRERQVTAVETEIDPDEQQRLDKVEKRIPEIREAVATLKELVPDREHPVSISEEDPIALYLEWRASGDFYGQAGTEAGYLSGKNLLNILDEANAADIAAVKKDRSATDLDRQFDRLNDELREIANRLAPEEHEVGTDFEIVLNPSREQLAQIALLRNYVRLTTEADFPNDVFIYKGSGSKGINLGKKAIGIHEELLKATVPFAEALTTTVHEVVHNEVGQHDVAFIKVLQALFIKHDVSLSTLSSKQIKREGLTDEEQVMAETRERWVELQSE